MMRRPKRSKNEVVAPKNEVVAPKEEEEVVPTISGEPSPIRHLGRHLMGDQQLQTSLVIITAYVHGLQPLNLCI
jgi:hypothetical protein